MEEAESTSGSRMRVALVAMAAIALIAFFASGIHRQIDPHSVRGQILDLGLVGPLVFIVAFAILQPLGPSGHIFVVAASLVWSGPIAFALSLVGAVGSQATSFAFYRFVAGDWARAKIPKRLLEFETRLVESPFRTVLVLRLLTFTWPLANAMLGISRVRALPVFAATTLGLAPTVAFDVWFLERAIRWLALEVGPATQSFASMTSGVF